MCLHFQMKACFINDKNLKRWGCDFVYFLIKFEISEYKAPGNNSN